MAATVTIPGEYVETVRDEANQMLTRRAESYAESLDWYAQGKAGADDLAQLREALSDGEAIVASLRDAEDGEDFELTADPASLATLLGDCLGVLADELKGRSEDARPDPDEIRRLLESLAWANDELEGLACVLS